MTDVVDSNAKTLVVDGDKNDNGFMGMWPLLASGMMSNQHNNLADLISGLHSAAAHREIIDAVRDEGRHTSDTVHTTSHNTEMTVQRTADANLNAIQTGELRLSKELCEVKELVREQGEKTRCLITDLDNQRVRDDLRQLQAEHIALKAACCPPCPTS